MLNFKLQKQRKHADTQSHKIIINIQINPNPDHLGKDTAFQIRITQRKNENIPGIRDPVLFSPKLWLLDLLSRLSLSV